jgi:hypothetical protein
MKRKELLAVLAIVAVVLGWTSTPSEATHKENTPVLTREQPLKSSSPLKLTLQSRTLSLALANMETRTLTIPIKSCKHVPWTAAAKVVLQLEDGRRLRGQVAYFDLRYLHPHETPEVAPSRELKGQISLSRLCESYGWDRLELRRLARRGEIRCWVELPVEWGETLVMKSNEVVLGDL